jgi:crotonobetainyl-CoA:carnitine CoA-transferase CaiB-like acyl-CoA transferase
MSADRQGPLAGIRVIDVSRALAGPFSTMVLGDLGADVIKLEMPDVGDEARYWGPPFATYIASNRNKRSIEVDLHSEEGQKVCLDLLRDADVFVENFRPGTVKRFNLDYDAVRAVNPRIVYCSISAYGQTGPLAHRPGIDLMVQAVSGLMAQTGAPDGPPYKTGGPVADIMGGFTAVVSIMGSIMRRATTGEGAYLDIAMLDGMLNLMLQQIVAYTSTGTMPDRWGNAHPLMAPYQNFSTSDRDIVIAVTNQKAWENFCTIEELWHLRADAGYATQVDRNINRVRLVEAIATIFATKPAAYWLAALDTRGIPAELIQELPELLAHEHLRQRKALIEVEYPPGSGNRVLTPGMPWRDVAAGAPPRDPPALGEHNEEILEALYGR